MILKIYDKNSKNAWKIKRFYKRTKEDGINGRFKLFINVNDGKMTYKKQTKKYKKSGCIRYWYYVK